MFKLFLLIILLVLLRFYISCNSSENFIENLDEDENSNKNKSSDKNKSDEDSHENLDLNNLLYKINNIKANCLMKPDLDDKTISLIKGPKGDMGGKTMSYFPLVNGTSSKKYFYYKTNGPADYQNIVEDANPELFKPPYMWAFTDENTFKCQYDNNLDFKNKDNTIVLDKNVKTPLKFRRTDKNTYIDTESNLCLTNNDNKITLKDCIQEGKDISTQQWYFQF